MTGVGPAAWSMLVLATLVAATVQGAFGFAFALLAISMFLLVVDAATAIQLLIILNLGVSLALTAPLRLELPTRLLRQLILGSLVGFPAGIVVFRSLPGDQLRAVVALVILLFVALLFARATPAGPPPTFSPRSGLTLGVGAVAGGLTTAVGLPGPPVMLFLTAIGQRKDAVRAAATFFFVVANGIALTLQATFVGIAISTWTTAAVLLPIAAAGAMLGHRLSPRLDEATFRAAILVLVAASGLYVLVDALLP